MVGVINSVMPSQHPRDYVINLCDLITACMHVCIITPSQLPEIVLYIVLTYMLHVHLPVHVCVCMCTV